MTGKFNLPDFKKIFFAILVLAIAALFVVYRSSFIPFHQPSEARLSFWINQIRHPSSGSDNNGSRLDYTEQFTKDKSQSGNYEGKHKLQRKFRKSKWRNLTNEPSHGDIDDKFGPVSFDINGSDVMVFLHIQKTGGSEFGRQLIGNIDLIKECDIVALAKKRKDCLRPNSDVETWLFSRYSTGWACGLHSDWTELHECVGDKLNEREKIVKDRKFFYITILRDPIKRFISEWKHVQRSATWKNTQFSCNGSSNQIPRCYSGTNWKGTTLQEFMSCPYNMGINRQTRMLADLRLVNCYQRWLDNNATASKVKELEDVMLQNAMENLKEMTFFGLLEEQRKLQTLFEHTFPFKFKQNFVQYNVTHVSDFYPTKEEMNAMEKLNYLDVKLYDYAKRLFIQRYQRMGS